LNLKECKISNLIKQIREYKFELLKGNLLALFATSISVMVPLFIPLLVDALLLGKESKLLDWVSTNITTMSSVGYIFFFLAVVLILRGIGFWLNTLQVKTFLKISKSITYKIREEAINHLKKVSLKEYETSSTSAIASKLISDLNTIDSFLGTTVSKLIISFLTILFTAIILIIIEWKLALFILITNPIVVFFTVKLARGVGKLKRAENLSIQNFQSSLVETLDLIHQIKASNKEEYFFSKVLAQAKDLKEKSIEFSFKSDRAIRFSFLVFLSGYELFRSVSILVVFYGDLSVGLMLAVFGYLWIMMTPTQELIGFQYSLANAKTSCKRVGEIFEMETESKVESNLNPFKAKEAVEVELKDVSFGYFDDKMVLKNINMKIEAGSKVAIVGPSGSGKTTLANLIVGFYQLKYGDIFYNQVSIKETPLSKIRENIYLILQNPKLFNDTLEFNLTLGRKYPKSKIEEAIKIAKLESVVESLKDGLKSQIGIDGVRLSGGQRQRVAIARMILINPKMVILDESTSALDTQTEQELFLNLQEWLRPKSVVTIAHRLSTIQNADFIYVLEDGRVSDFGKPKELFKKEQGYFGRMI